MYDHAKAIRHALLVAKSAASQVGLPPIYKAIGGYLEPTAQHMPTSGITGRDKGGAVDINPNYDQNLSKHMEGAHPDVLNEDGTPKVFYHGTKRDFDTFKPKYEDNLTFLTTNPKFASKWPVGNGGLRANSEENNKEYERMRELQNQISESTPQPIENNDEDFMRYRKAVRDEMKRQTGYDSPYEWESHAGTRVMPVYISSKNPFNPKKDWKKIEPYLLKHPTLSEVTKAGHHKTGNWLVYENKDVINKLKGMGHDSVWLSEDTNGPMETLAAFNPNQIKSASGNNGDFAPGAPIHRETGGLIGKARELREKPAMGINVKSDTKAGLRYADLIVDGRKTLESRNSDTLRPYVGKRVAIVRTGEGPAKAIGEVTIGEPTVVNKNKFRSMEPHHMVPQGSQFDISASTKHLYPMHDPVRYETESDVGHGIIARKVIHKAGGGGFDPDAGAFGRMRQHRDPSERLQSKLSHPSIVKHTGGDWIPWNYQPTHPWTGLLNHLKYKMPERTEILDGHYLIDLLENLYEFGNEEDGKEEINKINPDWKYLSEYDNPTRWYASGPTAHDALVEASKNFNQHISVAPPHISKWIDSNLKKYLLNDLGTMNDPVRHLADQGILHYEPDEELVDSHKYSSEAKKSTRSHQLTGIPTEPQGKTDLAKKWETITDLSIHPNTVKHAKIFGVNAPWLQKKNENDIVYHRAYPPNVNEELGENTDSEERAAANNLGLTHLIDVLTDSTNPNSVLPNNLKINPNSLSRMSMAQAVQHVHNVNEYMAKNRKQIDIEKGLNTKIHKEYPDGMRWVQLDKPGQFKDESDAMGHSVRGYDTPAYGGYESYGVGGHKAIQSGAAKIYSLRDKTNQPHVTIEARRHPAQLDGMPEHYDISQIKGKSNRKPHDRYQPYVTDFIQSGNHRISGDLSHTDLYNLDENSDLAKAMQSKGLDVPKTLTNEQMTNLSQEHLPNGPTQTLFKGGRVRKAYGGGFNDGGGFDPDAGAFGRIGTDPQQQLQSRLAGPQIMKEPGGQWLSGSVEDALPKRIMASQSPRVSAVNDFVSKQLTRYIKNDMGTEGDPIRALAERGILHYEPAGAENEDIEYLNKNRKQKRGLAINPLAKDWENHSDLTINSFNKNQLEKYRDSKYVLEENPWINKLEPNDVIHNISAHPIENLGFKHLIDELHNSTNPESGLPNHLQLRPESLSRMSVPQAVQHVHNINKWREENRLDANKEKAFNPATFLHKDYPDSDYAWYQIRHPDMTDEEKKLVYTTYTKPEDYPKKLRDKRNALEKALEYEGDTMGNCVGGYTDKVIWGNDIYSLRNKKTGEPHVTIETIPFDQNKFELPREIEQIKGKGNKKPANRYLPYVHDFVKSGNWSKVNELQNTDLVDLSKNIEHQQIAKNHGRFHTKEEANKLLAQHYGKGSFNPYATGGAIIAKAVGGSIDPQKAIRQALMVSKGMKNATC